MAAARGEATYSSKGRQVKKMTFEPIPPGTYELKLDTSASQVQVAEANERRPYPFPRVSVRFIALGTGKDGGKDRLVFHDFYVRTEPNEKGTILVEMPSGLVAFARALGQELEKVPLTDWQNGEDTTERVFNPQWVKQWLENRDGEVVKGRVRVETGDDGEKRNRIQSFEEADSAPKNGHDDGKATGSRGRRR